jgi:hypothetical protein
MDTPQFTSSKFFSNMSQPSPAPVPNYTRSLLLAISLALFVGGVLLRYTELVEPGSRKFVADTLLKVGFVVGLAWLAAPQLERLGWQRLRGTGLAIIIAVGGLTAVRPRLGGIAAGIVIGGFLVLAVLGWVRSVIFNGSGSATIPAKSRKIEKNPTRR